MRTAVLISGRGSNMEALVRNTAIAEHPAEIALVVSDRPDAPGLKIAKEHGIDTLIVDYEAFADKSAAEAELQKELKTTDIGLICLAGFMRILSADFLTHWPDRVLNIHPSLLPVFRGLNTHDRAIRSGVRIHGATVHVVRPELDDGPIILQAAVPVLPSDDADTLAARVLACEHIIYPEALRLVASEQVKITGNVAVLRHFDAELPDNLIWPETITNA